MVEKLGVDVGGVITEGGNEMFTEQFLLAKQMEGAFDALTKLQSRFGDRIYVVSKCGVRMQQKTVEWMNHHRFEHYTGIPRNQVEFCLERYQKGGIAERLGLTHFIDDRLEILGCLPEMVATRILFRPKPAEVKRFERFLDSRVHQVQGWNDVLKLLLP